MMVLRWYMHFWRWRWATGRYSHPGSQPYFEYNSIQSNRSTYFNFLQSFQTIHFKSFLQISKQPTCKYAFQDSSLYFVLINPTTTTPPPMYTPHDGLVLIFPVLIAHCNAINPILHLAICSPSPETPNHVPDPVPAIDIHSNSNPFCVSESDHSVHNSGILLWNPHGRKKLENRLLHLETPESNLQDQIRLAVKFGELV